MKLEEYLFRARITKSDFAKMLDVSRPHLSQIIADKRRPSAKLAKRILEITKGHVSIEELLFPEEFPSLSLENIPLKQKKDSFF